MNKRLFKSNHGIIVACDIDNIEKLQEIISTTSDVTGVVGYKIGCTLALRYGLPLLVRRIRNCTDLPIIYDHQKAGTDIPQIGQEFANVCKEGGVEGVILFPQAGPVTEIEFIKNVFELDMIPLVGGEMTHPKYLSREGGFIHDDAPFEMYKIAAELKVEYFIVPGTKPEMINKYSTFLAKVVEQPKFCFPGIGRQGGDIEEAVKAANGNPAYAIIGSAIYSCINMREGAKRFCDVIMNFE